LVETIKLRVMKKRILIVAEDKSILEEARQKLDGETDLVTVTAVSCDAGIELALQLKPHLILLDAGLSGLSDDAVCRRLRRDWETNEIPLLVLLDAVGTRGEAFARALGADDYVSKPIVSQELALKVRTMLRHQRNEAGNQRVFDDGRLYIDFDAYLIRVNSCEPKLTLKEFSLLKFLIQNQGRVFSRDKLLDVVWGYQRFGKTRTVDVHVRRIRKKLGLGSEDYIQTIISVGYQFKPQNHEHPTPLTAQPGLSSL
jgi:two-component system, OmpR family, alkaline phosphatase synthesis response regulator PhoP